MLTDRRATIRSVLKVVHFLRTVWDLLFHPHTQSALKQGIKIHVIYLLFAYHHYFTVLLPFVT
jgi:hypothetical protein